MTIRRFNGSERRAYVRLEKSRPVRLKVTGNPTSKTFTATTKNISQGGICLEIHQNNEALHEALFSESHKIGIDINTLIPKPNYAVSDRSHWISARADWTCELDQAHQKLLVGLEFEDLSEEARKRIRDYLVEQFLQKYPECH